VEALDGMFAFALWDARRRRLLLARDRTGKKPLFYHDGPRHFAFASEVKGLLAHPEVPHERDETALPLYLTYGYVPTPRTLYRGILSLPPAHRLVATETGLEGPTPYWRVRFRTERFVDEREAESASGRSCAAPWSGASWPTFPSVPSSPAGSTPRRSSP